MSKTQARRWTSFDPKRVLSKWWYCGLYGRWCEGQREQVLPPDVGIASSAEKFLTTNCNNISEELSELRRCREDGSEQAGWDMHC